MQIKIDRNFGSPTGGINEVYVYEDGINWMCVTSDCNQILDVESFETKAEAVHRMAEIYLEELSYTQGL